MISDLVGPHLLRMLRGEDLEHGFKFEALDIEGLRKMLEDPKNLPEWCTLVKIDDLVGCGASML